MASSTLQVSMPFTTYRLVHTFRKHQWEGQLLNNIFQQNHIVL